MSRRDPYIVRTERIRVNTRAGRKRIEKMVGQGWEIVSEQVISTQTLLGVAMTNVTFRKPNPKAAS